jgi:hypothetical protein
LSAAALRSSGVRLRAVAWPPLRPNATAAGFLMGIDCPFTTLFPNRYAALRK